MHKVLIGLGSNLDAPVEQVKRAITKIADHKAIRLITCSSLYESLPQGPQDQGNFINAVISIETSLDPEALLKFLQSIERQQGRIKTRHWGERCIDLDILFIEGAMTQLNLPHLIIPHPHALTRDFVLIPAIEIAADWVLPDGSRLQTALADCLKHDLKKLAISC